MGYFWQGDFQESKKESTLLFCFHPPCLDANILKTKRTLMIWVNVISLVNFASPQKKEAWGRNAINRRIPVFSALRWRQS